MAFLQWALFQASPARACSGWSDRTVRHRRRPCSRSRIQDRHLTALCLKVSCCHAEPNLFRCRG
eukprot:19293-Eustigmatos_ZCMA.PRE.1